MKNIFARWGIPEELVSDNGTQFTAETFRSFAEAYGFRQTFSSPHYPQSNGEAESAVKIAKKILRQDDVFAALMEYRATPIEPTGISPTEMMLGRKIRTLLPSLPSALIPDWLERDDMRLKDSKYKEMVRTNYDRGTKPLSPLSPGDRVRIKIDSDKSWSSSGRVVDGDADRRSYTVQTETGRYRRNRRHLQFAGRGMQNIRDSDTNAKSRLPGQVQESDQGHRDTPVPNRVRESAYSGSENPATYQDRGKCADRQNEKPVLVSYRETRARGHSDTPVPTVEPGSASVPANASIPKTTRSGRLVVKPKKLEDFYT